MAQPTLSAKAGPWRHSFPLSRRLVDDLVSVRYHCCVCHLVSCDNRCCVCVLCDVVRTFSVGKPMGQLVGLSDLSQACSYSDILVTGGMTGRTPNRGNSCQQHAVWPEHSLTACGADTPYLAAWTTTFFHHKIHLSATDPSTPLCTTLHLSSVPRQPTKHPSSRHLHHRRLNIQKSTRNMRSNSKPALTE